MAETARGAPAKITLPTDEQILITREFDAPRHLVYRAWTTPELVRRWWAGHRGEVTQVEMDLRVGGRWRYVLVAGGGFDVAFHGEYREIVPNERIVNTEVFEMPGAQDLDPAEVPVNTVTFTEVAGRTTLTLLTQTASRELRDTILNSGMEVGMQEQMEVIEEIATALAEQEPA
ncbi:MAG: SRPBCC family protein [Labedaea sp.]